MTRHVTLRSLIVAAFGAHLCRAEPGIYPKPSRPNDIPDSPGSIPKFPPAVGIPNDSPGIGSATEEKAQAAIQYKMGKLEQKLELSGAVLDGAMKIAELVTAVLDEEDCATPTAVGSCATPTCKNCTRTSI